MTELITWKNQQMDKLRRDIDRLFDRFWSDFGGMPYPRAVSEGLHLEISETKEALLVRAEIPKMDPGDLEISVTNDILTIRGGESEKSAEEGSYYRRIEKRFSSFSRSIRLPCRVKAEESKATYENGTLTVYLPKREPEKGCGIRIEIK